MQNRVPSSQTNPAIYQLRVTLMNDGPPIPPTLPMPPIWRRIQVQSDVTLPKLHRILQAVMGWENYHLHLFTVNGKRYGIPDPEYNNEPGMKTILEWGVKLNRLLPNEGSKLIYEYDFGDAWEHEVIVERVLPALAGEQYPVCIEGEGACPPEDVGGVGGYEDFLAAVADPDYEDHEEMLQWAGLKEGEQYDANTFDIEAVNQKLRQLR